MLPMQDSGLLPLLARACAAAARAEAGYEPAIV